MGLDMCPIGSVSDFGYVSDWMCVRLDVCQIRCV